ncbi:unnamed protein product [Haemonchus placei]|uniref:Uncharacterized protein n=1 Tax=Haemonchus placei TaxID=6290 RepID=A0A3P8C0S4_HAEPC|nr:unnamed protein product [Haemonchus placei]
MVRSDFEDDGTSFSFRSFFVVFPRLTLTSSGRCFPIFSKTATACCAARSRAANAAFWRHIK